MVLIKMAESPKIIITSFKMGISGMACVCEEPFEFSIIFAMAKIKNAMLQMKVNRDKNLITFIIFCG